MGFAITIATVLLAVAISIAPTSSPIPSCPPLLPLNIFLIPPRRASKPPLSRISAHIAATSTATIHVSNMPDTPEPIPATMSAIPICPVISIMHIPDRMPVINTANTLNPAIPPAITST